MKKRIYIIFLFLFFIDGVIRAQTKVSWQNAAEKAFEAEDYSTSLNYFLAALEYDDEDPYVLMMAGECNRRLFTYKSALLWFNRSAMGDKLHRYPENFFHKAETHLALGEFEDAKKMLNNYVYPDSSAGKLQKAEKLLKQIIAAETLTSLKDTTDLSDAGKNVNTAFSDFAASAINDSTFMYSSLRFENPNSKKKEYASMILKANMDSSNIYKSSLLPDVINSKSWHNCNASVSPDGKIMVFSRCNYDKNNKLVCKLYESQFVNSKWQTPTLLSTDINKTESTTTQPCISNAGEEGYHLFFASDRSGSIGETDIYHSIRNAKGVYSPAAPVVQANTTGREVSPYYNPITSELFFSSDSLEGLGAFDIYKINYKDAASLPVNIGLPFNSGYNDVYFSENLRHPGEGFLSSNRPGSTTLYGNVCCYDIYRFSPTPPSPPVVEEIAVKESETIIPVQPAVIAENPVELKDNLMQLLPLKLYFDNDYPDPRSRKKTTSAVYDQLYADYSGKIGNYIEGFSGDKTRTEDDARDAIEKFFITELQFNYKQLNKFTVMLADVLDKKYSVHLTVQGFASPLAETDYNLILSARRTASILNYWKTWENGRLAHYISSSDLVIEEVASGERAVDVSDKATDKANSVYNPGAAKERRIEVIDVTVSKP